MTRLALALSYAALLVLLAGEVGLAMLPMVPWLRVILLIPAAAMTAIVAAAFMEIGQAPVIARGFAAAGLVWLVVLLGLGSMDRLTRTDHAVTANPGAASGQTPSETPR